MQSCRDMTIISAFVASSDVKSTFTLSNFIFCQPGALHLFKIRIKVRSGSLFPTQKEEGFNEDRT